MNKYEEPAPSEPPKPQPPPRPPITYPQPGGEV